MIELLKNKNFFITSLVLTIISLLMLFIVKGSMPILDARFFYYRSEINELFEVIGQEGRNRYIIINILDFLFICFYTMLFYSGFARFFQDPGQLKVILILPTILYFADTFETSMIFYSLWIYPIEPAGVYTLLVLATPFKWFMALATLLVFINGYILKKYFQ